MAIDVSIALATYNGSRYITELLDSIKSQTYNNFIIHVCDDGSSDNTLELLHQHPLYTEGKLIVHDVTVDKVLSKTLNVHYRTAIRTIYVCVTKMIIGCLIN